jgi:hypothetical protein
MFVVKILVLVGLFLLACRMFHSANRPSEQRTDPCGMELADPSIAVVLPVSPHQPLKHGRPLAAAPASAVLPLPNAAGGFSGEVIAFTGTLDCATREAAMSRVAIAGGRAYDTMPAGVTLLVVGKKPGKNKLEKARRWNIPVIDESAFKRRCSSGVSQAQTAFYPAPAVSLTEFAARISA